MDERTIQTLLDLHRFTQDNRRLRAMIGAAGEKYGLTEGRRALSDDEVEVWAAGDLSAALGKEGPFGGDGGEG